MGIRCGWSNMPTMFGRSSVVSPSPRAPRRDAPNMTMPYGVPESFHEHIQVQWDLLALAYQADITRVATMLFARDLTSRTFPESGTNASFHGVSHHAEDPGQIALLAKINRYHVQMLAYLVQKLDAIPEGDGTRAGSFVDPVRIEHG